MAETYEQYLKNARAQQDRVMENSVGAAMDQVDLLRGVRQRVQEFVDFYESDMEPTMNFIREQREKGSELSLKTAELAEYDVQTVANDGSPTTRASSARLTLDDLKILLEQFPQKDF